MNRIKSLVLALPICILLLGVIAVPVYARDGDSGSGSNSDSSSSDSSSESNDSTSASSSDSATETETEHATEVETGHTETRLRAKGQELLKEAQDRKQQVMATKDDATAKVKELRQKRCETRKHGLETKVANIVKVAQKHKTRIDDVYAKALAYQKDKNVSVSGFDQLVATADAAKTKAQTSVDALTNLKPTIQCDSSTVASDVATFKAAAQQARTDLQSYRQSVKAILTALEAAKESN